MPHIIVYKDNCLELATALAFETKEMARQYMGENALLAPRAATLQIIPLDVIQAPLTLDLVGGISEYPLEGKLLPDLGTTVPYVHRY